MLVQAMFYRSCDLFSMECAAGIMIISMYWSIHGEIVRSRIQSVDHGQSEGALSLE